MIQARSVSAQTSTTSNWFVRMLLLGLWLQLFQYGIKLILSFTFLSVKWLVAWVKSTDRETGYKCKLCQTSLTITSSSSQKSCIWLFSPFPFHIFQNHDQCF